MPPERSDPLQGALRRARQRLPVDVASKVNDARDRRAANDPDEREVQRVIGHIGTLGDVVIGPDQAASHRLRNATSDELQAEVDRIHNDE